MTDRPNILYIHSHDTGRYVQPYGHAIDTPHLQALAEQGTLFRQAFCCAPTCSPSRAALLTGQYAHQAGMVGLTNRGCRLNDFSRHIVHTLRKVGYTSALAGIQHIADHDQTPMIGYDAWLNPDGPAPHVAAARWLDEAPSQPFFLSVGFGETHRAFPPLDQTPDDPRYTLPPAPLPDTPQVRQDMARYKASARDLDAHMGEVFEALKRNGLWDNTLVICTTDHGIAFPRMKCNLTDSGIGVMLIVKGPGGFDGGHVVDSIVSHIDIYPTLCELSGVDKPDWLEGQSLLPLMRGEVGSVRDALFAEVSYHASYEPQRCVRTQRYKYIRRFDQRDAPVLPNCDAGEAKRCWVDAGWTRRDPASEALYDTIFDPNEADNRAADPALADVLAELRGRLDRWMAQTDDPLLHGPVPTPPGSKLNPVDDPEPGGPMYTVGPEGDGWRQPA